MSRYFYLSTTFQFQNQFRQYPNCRKFQNTTLFTTISRYLDCRTFSPNSRPLSHRVSKSKVHDQGCSEQQRSKTVTSNNCQSDNRKVIPTTGTVISKKYCIIVDPWTRIVGCYPRIIGCYRIAVDRYRTKVSKLESTRSGSEEARDYGSSDTKKLENLPPNHENR